MLLEQSPNTRGGTNECWLVHQKRAQAASLPHPCNLLLQRAGQTVAFHFITSKVSRKHAPESIIATCNPSLPLILNSAYELKQKVRLLSGKFDLWIQSLVSPNHSRYHILSFMIWSTDCLSVLLQLLRLVGPEIQGKAKGCCKPKGCKH